MKTTFKTSFLFAVAALALVSNIALDAAPRQKRCQQIIQYKRHQVYIPSESEMIAMELLLKDLINQERAKYGLAPLRELKFLSHYAKEHSLNMAEGRVAFGHGGFKDRANAVMRQGKHDSFGENVAYCFLVENPLQTMVAEWMASPGHRDNILGDYNETGLGIVYNKEGYCYMTQLFARRF